MFQAYICIFMFSFNLSAGAFNYKNLLIFDFIVSDI